MRPQLTRYDMGPGVVAFSTTRHGGCSTGPYASFNVNAYCGDDPEAVSRNRALLGHELGLSPDRLLMPHQVHAARLALVDAPLLALSPTERAARLDGFDALSTALPGVCIGVSTADCIPILLFDPDHRAVCAVHAGWRGTVARIAEQSVRAMAERFATRPDRLRAVIGPGISLRRFEVGDEVYDAFARAGFDMGPISCRQSKWHIDLPECNRRQLLAAGVPSASIALSGVCTYDHADDYFSARRLGTSSGRIFTGIIIQPSNRLLSSP